MTGEAHAEDADGSHMSRAWATSHYNIEELLSSRRHCSLCIWRLPMAIRNHQACVRANTDFDSYLNAGE